MPSQPRRLPQELLREKFVATARFAVNLGPMNSASPPIRVLGVDPAAAGPTGYGIVEAQGRTCRALHFGALRVAEKRKLSAGAALEAVHALLCDLIEEFSPGAVAVESIFSALNVRTALRLAEVRGVVLLAAAQHQVEVFSYAPREIKASVAGYGHADKRQIQMMVRALLAMKEIPEPADAADALAVALCHLQACESSRRFGVKPSQPPARSAATKAASTTSTPASRISMVR